MDDDAVSQLSKIPEIPSNNSNTSKFFTHFLYKAAIVTIFLVLLPVFPLQFPEFIDQTLHTRSWELLQLIFVGIAVSYGLFSRKNNETEKDINNNNHTSKPDNAQSYVSNFLQVSSVFDDESENPTVIDENKVQTWNSQYYREEPVVVVAKEPNGCITSGISQKPLLLPVRSLKQRVVEPNEVEDLTDNLGAKNGSSSRKFTVNSRKPKSGESQALNSQKMEENIEGNVVFRSPIPWRSRSRKMEIKGKNEEYLVSPTKEESEFERVESRSFDSFMPDDFQAKSSEDLASNESFIPPPPPPPPPLFLRKMNSVVMKNTVSPHKELRRSTRSMPEEELQNDPSLLGKSVRTFKSTTTELEKKPTNNETQFVEKKGFTISNEEKNKLLEETSSDEESEEDNDTFESNSMTRDVDSADPNSLGPDVDKKADEFIAKFREQIRLQRIESIRKSTQRAGKALS